ncbi:MAG TPA: MCP four helix bundle domain-containing protein, partial [Burkholderiaceae bacterium]|nr:MCP four helix bundle domain-containing protein [Burkholderiaceae bacterium]
MSSMGVFALFELSDANTRLETVVNENNYRTEHANDLSQAVHVLAKTLRTVALLDDPAARDKESGRIQDARAQYLQAWQALEKLPASGEAAALRQAIAAIRDKTMPLNDRVIELAKADNRQAAVDLLLREAGPAADRWQEAIEAYLEYVKADSKRYFEEAEAAHGRAMTLMISCMALAGIGAALMGWLISRNITRRLA